MSVKQDVPKGHIWPPALFCAALIYAAQATGVGRRGRGRACLQPDKRLSLSLKPLFLNWERLDKMAPHRFQNLRFFIISWTVKESKGFWTKKATTSIHPPPPSEKASFYFFGVGDVLVFGVSLPVPVPLEDAFFPLWWG